MKYFRLGDIAPIEQSYVEKAESYWLLNLDKIESNTGKITEYNYVAQNQLKGAIISFDTSNVLYSKLRPYLNKVVVPKMPGYATSELLPLRPNKEIIDKTFLAYFLRSPHFVRYINEKSSGAKMPRAKTKDLLMTKVPCPEIDAQKKIVKKFSRLEKVINCKKEEIQLFDELIKARFVEMFGDPRDNPKMYKKESLGKHADVLVGYPFKSKEYSEKGIPIVGGYNLMQGYIEWEQCKYWPNESGYEKYLLRDNDIVLAMDRPWVGGGFKIARITNDHLPALLIQRTACVRGKDVEQEFLYALLNSEWFAEHCNITGSLVPHISGKDIANYEIILPSKTEQRDYVYFVHQVDKSKFFIFRIQACYNIFIQIDFNSQIF